MATTKSPLEATMSDVSSGARAPDGPLVEPGYPATTYETYPATAGAGGDDSTAKQVAGRAKETAADVRDTAKEQAQRVGSEAKTQARNVASDVRDRVGDQARTQNDKLVNSIRQTADQLDEMRGDRSDSPAATAVSRVADSGRQLADYLDRNGPDGVLREVQDFARRRPGAFLAAALAAGFVVGRLGKGVAKADPDAGGSKPATDTFVSTGDTGTSAGYAPGPGASTEYAATGTGRPVMVDEGNVPGTRAADRDYPGGLR
jgi:hypothetical protein